jgi:hypothetical protein
MSVGNYNDSMGRSAHPASAPAGGRAARPPSGGAPTGVKMPKKPLKLSLFQTMRTTASGKSADRQQGRIARSAAQIQVEMGLGRDLSIFHAAQVGSYNLLRAVLDRGQPVNASDDTCRTALHHAAKHGHYDVAEHLIQAGADTMARTRDNESTPLHEVASGEVAELLIRGKADANCCDEWGLSPLHYAAQSGNCDVVRCLIEYNAAVCPLDGLGRTPLHLAAQHGRVEAVQELATLGADLSARDRRDRTPLAVAEAFGQNEVVAVLKPMEMLLGNMGAEGTSLRALPVGSPARMTRYGGDASILGCSISADAADVIMWLFLGAYPLMCVGIYSCCSS